LISLSAVVVGIEHEPALVVTLQQNHSRRWLPIFASSGERHCLRKLKPGAQGAAEPPFKLPERIWVRLMLQQGREFCCRLRHLVNLRERGERGERGQA